MHSGYLRRRTRLEKSVDLDGRDVLFFGLGLVPVHAQTLRHALLVARERSAVRGRLLLRQRRVLDVLFFLRHDAVREGSTFLRAVMYAEDKNCALMNSVHDNERQPNDG